MNRLEMPGVNLGPGQWAGGSGTAPVGPRQWDRASGTAPAGPRQWDRASGATAVGDPRQWGHGSVDQAMLTATRRWGGPLRVGVAGGFQAAWR